VVSFSSYLTLNNIVALKFGLQVTDNGTIRKLEYSFLLAFYSKYAHIFSCFWDVSVNYGVTLKSGLGVFMVLLC